VRLEYNPGSSLWACPNESILRDLLASQLGYDPVTPGATDLLTVSVTRRGRRFHAKLSAADATGRLFWNGEARSDRDCTDLLTSTALVIRIGIGPFRSHGRHSPAPSSGEAAPPSSSHNERPSSTPLLLPAPSTSTAKPAASPAPTAYPRYLFGAGTLVAVNRAPLPALGFAVSAMTRWAAVSVLVDGSALVPFWTEVRSEQGELADVRPSLVRTSLGPCGHIREVFFVCTLVELGTRQFSGSPNIDITVEHPLSAGVDLRGGAEWFFTDHFALHGHTELGMLLTQTVLTVEKREFWRSPVVTGTLSIGIVYSFEKASTFTNVRGENKR
jgi:hypothetical protein